MSPNCWRLEIAAFSSSGGCGSSYENGWKTPRVFSALSKPKEAAARLGFLTVGTSMGLIWTAVKLRQTVP